MIGFPKSPISSKVLRAKKRAERTTKEDAEKKKVRLRDRYCRFPLCGCKKYALPLHVSHKVHKGMGGNPKGERSTDAGMVLVCSARHRENRIAIDRGTLKWEPLTVDGANGPIGWWVDAAILIGKQGMKLRTGDTQWMLLAEEITPHFYRPDSIQRHTLGVLAEMEW